MDHWAFYPILDLLYYGFLNEGADGESAFDPDYLEFKAEVGFNFPPEYLRYKDFFRTTLNLRVYKHNFSFNETGKVELDIIAIGNIESDYSNKTKYNILESKEIATLRKVATFFSENLNIETQEQFYSKVSELDSEIEKIVGNQSTYEDLIFRSYENDKFLYRIRKPYQNILDGISKKFKNIIYLDMKSAISRTDYLDHCHPLPEGQKKLAKLNRRQILSAPVIILQWKE